MSYILALDQGTTSSRAILFDEQSQIVASAQREFEQIFPQAGWVEHDPNEIWSSQCQVAIEAVTAARLAPEDIAAIGISNQRETVILWNRRSGEPVANAVVWQDRRSAAICDELRARGLEPLFQEKTGLVIDPYFSGTKIKWLLDNIDGLRQRTERGELAFGTVDAWLVWKLTEGQRYVTDAANASRTLLFNIHTGDWDDELLAALDVPRSMLPEVISNSEVVAHVSAQALAGTALFDRPIAGLAGDQQAALFGQRCFAPGLAKNTYGTGCFLLMNTGRTAQPSQNKLLTTVGWRLGGATEYALEGSVFVGGAVVQWLRDGLGLVRDAAEIEALAANVNDNGGVYLVPAFAGLGAPHWDPYARGALMGITRGTTAAHLARAALEAIAFQSCDVLKAMERDAGLPLQELRVDGGASRNDLLMQFQADLLQVPVVRPAIVETTALGATYLAGLAVGVWKDQAQIAASQSHERRFYPQRPQDEMQGLHEHWQRAVQRAVGWERGA